MVAISQSGDDENAFKLIEAGALEVLPKPEGIIAGAKNPDRRILWIKLRHYPRLWFYQNKMDL